MDSARFDETFARSYPGAHSPVCISIPEALALAAIHDVDTYNINMCSVV